ncbi:MAG TPA: cell division protein FtsZ [Roseimicrobium sp.]|nr:cell division protein FtsZ [Roseimicrobium sp.]
MNSSENMHIPTRGNLVVKVFGVGGAGGNAVSHLSTVGLDGVQCVAVNTDAQALAAVQGADVVHLGTRLMRGLGAGGDPTLGNAAAESDSERLKALCAGADIVFIIAGLGGGTGTGASPVLARVARETGALVLAVVTLPFDCEGTRRRRQAQLGLEQLKVAADAVICLSNQKVFGLINENTSLVESFKLTNDLLAQGVRGIWRLVTRTGLINLDFADLCSVLRGRHAEGFCASSEATGPNRSREVVEKVLSHPLLDGGKALASADAVLVSIVGGHDLTLTEVNRIMEQINRHCDAAHVTLGAAIEPEFNDRLAITVVASQPALRAPAQDETEEPLLSAVELPTPSETSIDTQFLHRTESDRPASRFVAPAPNVSQERAEELLAGQKTGSGTRKPRKGPRLKQTQLPLEIVSKGRFEKSEPTIHKGEDLDVPTYIRRGVALN